MNAAWYHIFITILILTGLEIVLGVDNIVFLTIVTSRLSRDRQALARRIGIVLATVTRLLLLALAVWITLLVEPIFYLGQYACSARDLLFIFGGLFLFFNSMKEFMSTYRKTDNIEEKLLHESFKLAVLQIMLFDMIFSLDSIITAIGIAQTYWVMALAVVIGMLFMLFASDILSQVIHRHVGIKRIALGFLVILGVVLIADGFHWIFPRVYLYFALAFALLIEVLHIGYAKTKTIH